ncbi:hypothetical protein [Marinobacter shengliensis]|uniref:hypothetical protein n=1 Tax=Marinobacter shengliensis TaxID=1389223 RepID=UPI002572B761|nr:hypothetical protein [Marinobacter shengliensis]BEH16489.1 hypothetical protein MAALD49_38570 [Marinobacter shengliensis]
MKVDDLVNRVDELLSMGQEVLASRRRSDWGEYVDSGLMSGFRSASLSFIERVYGSVHPHFSEIKEGADGSRPSDADKCIAVLRAVRSEIGGGWLFSIKGLITAEVFADFIEMAEHLLDAGYKDPAAVMCGGVLEEHLRQLCLKNGMEAVIFRDGKEIPKKADTLNADLARAEIYSKLDQKMITGWLDLRNKAAHGHYDEYTADQVKNLLSSVTEFMARVSV